MIVNTTIFTIVITLFSLSFSPGIYISRVVMTVTNSNRSTTMDTISATEYWKIMVKKKLDEFYQVGVVFKGTHT